MTFARSLAAAVLGLVLAAPAAAQEAPPPKLVVVISVDQFSADLFAEYRGHFTGGLARLQTGAVFPSGYQGHAATETCPGHSTILTGARPARTGIIGNDWIDFKVTRDKDGDHAVYCAEDESVPGSTNNNYTVSDRHLKVPTLGEWMKLANPASRVVSVAGKDRAAVMMGGHRIDEIWYWFDKAQGFASYPGRPVPAAVERANRAYAASRREARPAMALPDYCKSHDRSFDLGKLSVGSGRFARPADLDGKGMGAFKASPDFDAAIVGLAGDLAADMKLGQGAAPDLLIVGASATDYIGHGLGTGGSEMCIQMFALDRTLGRLFDRLDASGVDYAVVLTADHGGHDLVERNQQHGAPTAERLRTVPGEKGPQTPLSPANVGKAIAKKLKLKGKSQLLWGYVAGDIYIDPALGPKTRAAVRAEALRIYRGDPQVYAVYTREQIAATPMPKGPPETWSMLERARASYDRARSGDFVVALKPRVTPIALPRSGYVATHGSFWDYDRRVPILFWRKGMTQFEQPLSIETVDIAPTLAALLHVPVPVTIDGRCLDLDAGPGDSCQ
jgi:predicted AlkP superfamily pyrophosphatase or phosphodiesterase